MRVACAHSPAPQYSLLLWWTLQVTNRAISNFILVTDVCRHFFFFFVRPNRGLVTLTLISNLSGGWNLIRDPICRFASCHPTGARVIVLWPSAASFAATAMQHDSKRYQYVTCDWHYYCISKGQCDLPCFYFNPLLEDAKAPYTPATCCSHSMYPWQDLNLDNRD